MTTVTFAEAPALVRSFRKPQSPDQTLGGGGDSPVFKEVERGGSPAKTVKPVKRKGSTKRKSWQPTAAHTPERSAEDPSAADGPAEADGRAGGAGSDWMLFEATEFSLVKKRHGQLSKMCEDRGLLVQGETGLTKRDMIMLLLRWRDNKMMPPSLQNQQSHPKPLLEDTAGLMSALDLSSDASSSPTGSGAQSTPMPTPTPTPRADHYSDSDAMHDLSELDSLNLTRIQATDIKKGSKIGSGGFKDVYKGRYLGKYRVAIADIRGQLAPDDIKEIRLLKDFRHPNVVRFVGVCLPETPQRPVQIVSCAHFNTRRAKTDWKGSLAWRADYIRARPAPDLQGMLELMLGAARGCLYLHSHNPPILHRDIKSLNVLVNSHGVAKINDFGLARVKNSVASLVQTACGTLNWQAPELWCPEPNYTFSVDVYSLALVYWEMLCWHLPEKKYPFQGMNEHAIYLAVGKDRLRPSTSALKPRYGSIVINLVHAMWAHDPASRPSLHDVVEALEWMIQQGSRLTQF